MQGMGSATGGTSPVKEKTKPGLSIIEERAAFGLPSGCVVTRSVCEFGEVSSIRAKLSMFSG